jgi:hypothetical protein
MSGRAEAEQGGARRSAAHLVQCLRLRLGGRHLAHDGLGRRLLGRRLQAAHQIGSPALETKSSCQVITQPHPAAHCTSVYASK